MRQDTNVTIQYWRKLRMREILPEQSRTKNTKKTRDTNITIHNKKRTENARNTNGTHFKRKLRVRKTLTEQSITKNTKNTRDTNATVQNKNKVRMRATLTERSITGDI